MIDAKYDPLNRFPNQFDGKSNIHPRLINSRSRVRCVVLPIHVLKCLLWVLVYTAHHLTHGAAVGEPPAALSRTADVFIQQSNAPTSDASAWRLTDGQSGLPPLGIRGPKQSDVIFSTRWKRRDSIDTLKAFHATRCEWVYSTDASFIREVQSSGAIFGGTINSTLALSKARGTALDLDGHPITAPWMKAWDTPWITTTDPESQDALLTRVRHILDAGSDSLHIDGARFQAATVPWGGDFHEATLRGFGSYLQQHAPGALVRKLGLRTGIEFDYRRYLKNSLGIKTNSEYIQRLTRLDTTPFWSAYLRETVRPFYKKLRRLLDNYRARRVPMSINIHDLRPIPTHLFLIDFVDYIIGEAPSADIATDALRVATARALGRPYVVSMFPSSVAQTRLRIARYYALGASPLVPWDVFMGSKKSRYFGRPEDYADLYAFVRKYPQLFDHYDTGPIVGVVIPTNRYNHDETIRVITRLVRHHIPFALLLSGGQLGEHTLDVDRLNRFRAIALTGALTELSANSQRSLADSQTPVFGPQNLTSQQLSALAPVMIHKEQDLFASIRIRTDRIRPSMSIHLTRLNTRGVVFGTYKPQQASIKLNRIARLGAQVRAAFWYTPDAPPTEVSWSDDSGKLLFRVPSISEWGILHLEFDDI